MNSPAFLPFPYLTSNSALLNRGAIFDIPIFCKRNHNTHICKNFYRNIDATKTCSYKCPYGFGVEVLKFGDETIIFTALNVEKYSDRKEIQKRLYDKDFLPRLSSDNYEYMRDNSIALFADSKDYLAHKHLEETQNNAYAEKIEGLDNTFHELRKLNKQLKSQVESLIFQSDIFSHNRNNIERIKYLSKNIFHSSQLITIRLNTYDFTVNPDLSLQEIKTKMPIHKKFVKIAYNLREYAHNKRIRIDMSGRSYGYIYGNDIFELLPYLLLDNAIKYSQSGKNIEVVFIEDSDKLIVIVKSFSIRPDNHELSNLKARGVRGRNTEGVHGQGIGLYIADMICQTHNIDLAFKLGNERYYDHANNNIAYSDFHAILTFNEFEYGNPSEFEEEEY